MNSSLEDRLHQNPVVGLSFLQRLNIVKDLDAHFVVILVISGWQNFLMILLQATPVQFSGSKRNNRICGSWFKLVSVFGQELFLVAKASSLPSSNVAAKFRKMKIPNHVTFLLCSYQTIFTSKECGRNHHKSCSYKVLEEEQNHKSSFTEESRGANNDDQLVENNSPDPNGQEAANKETYASIVSLNSIRLKHIFTVVCLWLSIVAVKTVLIKDIPPHLQRSLLSKAIKEQFGSLKYKHIKIRGYEDGYRYAFVEFIQPKSAHQAVQLWNHIVFFVATVVTMAVLALVVHP
ncbi:hypothetical protein L6452_31210 [Arctium lappa]|uniref:Uncharacterized protein n=1 Tax=Arctium lappa TaxID=4217 RepID=A0ACB8ZKE3_ARCLA|nr:hypothetical protein L6452_31210 [Arctium lappa]